MEVITVPDPKAAPQGKTESADATATTATAESAKAPETQPPAQADLQKAKDLEAQAIQKRKHAKEIAEARRAKDEASKVQQELAQLDGDPLAVLARKWSVPREVAYQRITAQMLGQQPKAPTADEALAAIRQELDDFKRSSAADKEQAQRQAQAQLMANSIATAKGIVASGGEKYAITKELGQEAAIVYLIQGEAERHRASGGTEGALLTFEQAAEKVEAHLEAEGLRVANLAKVKAKLTPTEQKTAPVAKTEIEAALQQRQPGKPAPKTLTNATSSAPPARVPSKRMTDAERFALAEGMIKIRQDA